MKFTDAHSTAAVCVPSRVAIMTGRYAWRTRGSSRNGPWGFIGPRLKPNDLTLGHLIKAAGYRTGYVGKWHLGLEMATTDGEVQGPGNVEYSKPVRFGPHDYGFDFSWILPGSLDMFPYAYLKNGSWVGNVTAQKGWSAFNRVGPAAENFEDTQVLDTFLTQAEGFIERNAALAREGKPFFLYVALTSPHTPTARICSNWSGRLPLTLSSLATAMTPPGSGSKPRWEGDGHQSGSSCLSPASQLKYPTHKRRWR